MSNEKSFIKNCEKCLSRYTVIIEDGDHGCPHCKETGNEMKQETLYPWYKLLKLARNVLKLSLRDVKKKTGISDSYLCQLENGEIKDPSFFKIVKLMKLYNLKISDLIED